MIKKLLKSLALPVMLVFIVLGCSQSDPTQIDDNLDLTNTSSISGLEAIKKWRANAVSREVLRCLSEDDFDSLKSMFCLKIAEQDGFDEELQGAIDFFEGKVISYDGVLVDVPPAKSVRNWEVQYLDYEPHILDIKTDADKSYYIVFNYFKVYAKDEKKVGIYDIKIVCIDDETSYVVGEILSQ